MAPRWMDVSDLPFLALTLLEREQLLWFPGWGFPRTALGLALDANPAVVWFLTHKCPEIARWVEQERTTAQREREAAGRKDAPRAEEVRAAEIAVLESLDDLLVYALDPSVYDAQPFLAWDSKELTGLVDFTGQTVIDVGAGTGRLTFVAAPAAKLVFAVDPVSNLRRYLRDKAHRLGFLNVYAVDGLITAIPFPDGFADVTMGGHVFGDWPEAELRELERVTRPGGQVVLCPGNRDVDDAVHQFLVGQGFRWAAFEEPRDGWVRKYWKTIPSP